MWWVFWLWLKSWLCNLMWIYFIMRATLGFGNWRTPPHRWSSPPNFEQQKGKRSAPSPGSCRRAPPLKENHVAISTDTWPQDTGPVAVVTAFPTFDMWPLMLYLQRSHPFCMSIADVGFISTQALWFCFGDGEEEDRVTWNCRVQMGYKSRKDSRQYSESRFEITYRWWKNSQIHSVAQCRPPQTGPPPWAGPPPLQRPVMVWQTPHGSSATQPVFV